MSTDYSMSSAPILSNRLEYDDHGKVVVDELAVNKDSIGVVVSGGVSQSKVEESGNGAGSWKGFGT